MKRILTFIQDVGRLRDTPIVDDSFEYLRDRVDSALRDQMKRFLNTDEGLNGETLLSDIERGFPKVITLCGSTKFKEQFIKAQFELTMRGAIVLSVGWFSHADAAIHFPTDPEKIKLDELHKRKIDISDEIYVINAGGYIGQSTQSEIEYARKINVPVRFMEEERK